MIVFLGLCVFAPTIKPLVAPVLGDGVSGEWRQGESVDYEFIFGNQIPEILTVTSDAEAGYFLWANVLEQDSITGRIYLYNGTTGYADFKIQVRGSSWNRVYIYDATYSGSTGILYFILSNGTRLSWTVSGAGLTSLELLNNATYNKLLWNDNTIRGFFEFSAAGGSTTGLLIDQFIVDYNNLAGTIRSEYFVVDPSSTLHRLSIDCLNYGTTINITIPSNWTYQSITPSASVYASAGNVILNQTVPTTYDVYFTSDDSLRISNVEEVWSQGFETLGSEYVTVFEGAVSQNLTSEVIVNPPTTADYLVSWSHFIESGSLYVNGTAYSDTGAWESHVTAYADLGRLNFSATNAFIDNVHVYERNLSSSNPSAGIMYHITPYGLYAYTYGTLYATVAQGSTVFNSGTLQTSGVGAWSFNLGLVTAGTYSFYTYTDGYLFGADYKWLDTFSNTSVWTNYGATNYLNMTGWDYKRQITLNDTTPEANYQVKLNFTTADLGNPYANIQADGDDLRFFDSSTVACDYYIMEDWDNTGTSYVWVEVATAGSTYLTMYYGNAGASAGSNMTATFIEGEDFEDGDYSDTMTYYEDQAGSSADITNGILTLHVDVDNNYLWFTDGFSGSVAVEWRSDGWVTDATYLQEAVVNVTACPSNLIVNVPETWARYYHGTGIFHYDEDESNVGETWDAGNKDWNDNLMYLTTSYYKDYTDGVLQHSQIADNEVNTPSTFEFRKFGNYDDYTIDWIFIRRFDGTEIIDSSFNTEKSTLSNGTQTSAAGINTFIGNFSDYGGFFVSGLSISTTIDDLLNVSLRSTYNTLNLTLTISGANYTYNPALPVADTFYNLSLSIETEFATGSITDLYIQDHNDVIQNFSLDSFAIIGYAEAVNMDVFTITVQQLNMTGVSLTKFSTDQYRLSVTGETYSDQLYNVSIDGQWANGVAEDELVNVNITSGTHTFVAYATSRSSGSAYTLFLEESVSSTYAILEAGDVEVRIYDVGGAYLEYRNYKVYSNYTGSYQQLQSDLFVMPDVNQMINITVYDVFDRRLNSSVYAYARIIEVFLDVSNVKIQNLQPYGCHVTWSFNGGSISEWIADHWVEEFDLYIGSYNLTIYYANVLTNGTVNENGTSVQYTMNLRTGEDYLIMVNGTLLDDILTNLRTTNTSISSLVIDLNGDVVTLSGTVDEMGEDVNRIEFNTNTGTVSPPPDPTPFTIFIKSLIDNWVVIFFGIFMSGFLLYQTRGKKRAERKVKNQKSLVYGR